MTNPRQLSPMFSSETAPNLPPAPLAEEAWLAWTIQDFVYQTEAYRATYEAAERWGWIAPMEVAPTEEGAEEGSSVDLPQRRG